MQKYSRINKTVKISCQGGHLFQVYHSLCHATFLGCLFVLYVISIQRKNLVSGRWGWGLRADPRPEQSVVSENPQLLGEKS